MVISVVLMHGPFLRYKHVLEDLKNSFMTNAANPVQSSSIKAAVDKKSEPDVTIALGFVRASTSYMLFGPFKPLFFFTSILRTIVLLQVDL